LQLVEIMARPQKLKPEEILDRATDLFWKKGADAVSTRDLESALDLKAPAIYRRFESKNLFLARSIDHYVKIIVRPRIVKILESSADPLDGLREFFFSMLEEHGEEPRLRGCLLTNTAAHQETGAPEVHAALHRGLGVIHGAFLKQIERAQVVGRISSQADAHALTQALFLSLQGLLTLARTGATGLEVGIETTFQLLGTDNTQMTTKGA